MMIRRPTAGRIHGLEVTGQMEGLTAASSEIDGAVLTPATGIGHPLLPSKARDALGLFPDLQQRFGSGALEGETRQRVRQVTWQDQPVRTHDEVSTAPPVHTGARNTGVVVGRHE